MLEHDSQWRPAAAPSAGGPLELVSFRVGDELHALHLRDVRRAVRAAAVTPVPDAPAPVLGVLDVGGRILPVLSIRGRLGVGADPIAPHMHFLLARMAGRDVVLPVDEVLGLVRLDVASWQSAARDPALGRFEGVVRLEQGLALIDDLEAFFSPDEWRRLDEAIAARAQ